MSEQQPMFTYDYYEPGKVYGEKRFVVDSDVIEKWRTVYPSDNDPHIMPGGMLAMVILDAVLTFHRPRPPGGLHAGQTFEVMRMPRIGDELLTEVTCLDKEIKKNRKFVRVKTITRNATSGDVMFTGIMTTIAAI